MPSEVHITKQPLLLDKADACKVLGGISGRMLDKLVADGRLNARKLGSRTVFLFSELEEFVAQLPSWEPK